MKARRCHRGLHTLANPVLRPLVEARGGEWEDLQADTFSAEGTGVRTALIAVGADWPFDSDFDTDVAALGQGEYYPKTLTP